MSSRKAWPIRPEDGQIGERWSGLRPHVPFTIVFALGAAVRVLTAIAYKPALMFAGDSYYYLVHAINLPPDEFHPAMYTAFLWPFQHLGARSAVAPVQHVLGLATAVALYALLLRLGLRPWVAALGCVPMLLDSYQIITEQYILAETLFQAFVVAAFVLLFWRERVSWVAGGVAALLISLSGLTRVVGLALIPIVVGYVLVRRRGFRAIASTIIAVAIPLLSYAAWYQSVHGSFALTGNTWVTVYGRVAPFADCSDLQLPRAERVLCDPRPVPMRPWPNYYVFWGSSPAYKLPESRADALLKDFSKRVILHQPGTYLGVVLGDFLHYFAPIRTTRRWDDPIEAYRFQEHLPPPRPPGSYHQAFVLLLPSSLQEFLREAVPFRQHKPFATAQPAAGIARVLRLYQDVATTPGPLLALMCVLGVLGVVGTRRSGRRSLRAESLVLAVSGLALLITPIATVIFDYRFMVPALPLLGAAGVIGATSLHRRWSRRHDKAQGSDTSAGTDIEARGRATLST